MHGRWRPLKFLRQRSYIFFERNLVKLIEVTIVCKVTYTQKMHCGYITQDATTVTTLRLVITASFDLRLMAGILKER